RCGRNEGLFRGELREGPGKGALPTQPFVDDDTQGILITGKMGTPVELLRGHVGDAPGRVPYLLVARTLGDDGQTKIREQDFVVGSQQQVLWLQIAMNQLLV